MRIDIQAEHILSFQDEKTRAYFARQALKNPKSGFRFSIGKRVLNTSGTILIRSGLGLHRLAGAKRTGERERYHYQEAI